MGVVALAALLSVNTAQATTFSVTAQLINQPSIATFPSVFPFSDALTGTFSFTDPIDPDDYDIGAGAGIGEDEFAGSNVSAFKGIASFNLSLPTYGAVTGSGGEVSVFDPLSTTGIESFEIATGGTISDPSAFGGTVNGAPVPLTSGNATLVGVILDAESTNDLLSGDNVTDAALALINNLPGWNNRTDKQIRLTFSNPNAPSQTIEVDYQITSIQLIPLPAAAWLFASALGLMGWLRRRDS